MGNSTSRLYSALAKTLSSGASSKHQEYLEQTNPDLLDPIDPKDLLEECQIVLQKRPARLQRDFVDLRTNFAASHRSIRVMQWNILAQGMSLAKMLIGKWSSSHCSINSEFCKLYPMMVILLTQCPLKNRERGIWKIPNSLPIIPPLSEPG